MALQVRTPSLFPENASWRPSLLRLSFFIYIYISKQRNLNCGCRYNLSLLSRMSLQRHLGEEKDMCQNAVDQKELEVNDCPDARRPLASDQAHLGAVWSMWL